MYLYPHVQQPFITVQSTMRIVAEQYRMNRLPTLFLKTLQQIGDMYTQVNIVT